MLRRLAWYVGGDELALRVAPLRGGFEQRVVWDSGEWSRIESEARARSDTTGRGLGLQQVVLPFAKMVMRRLSPGDSTEVASMAVPVRRILGDSLRSGWYRLTVRGEGNVWSAGEFRAGDLELRLPGR